MPRRYRESGPGFLVLTSFVPSIVALLGVQVPLAARDALVHELAQLLPHVFSGHDLVLLKSTGVSAEMIRILAASHLRGQKNAKGPRKGIAEGTTHGSERNVFFGN